MILVVGGAGYLGSHVSERLRNSHDDYLVYDNLMHRNDFINNHPFVYGDVTDHIRLSNTLDIVDTVIWLAAVVGDAACNINPKLALDVNVEAVRFLADKFDGRVIFTSTASVYGKHDGLATCDSPLNPQSLYAETKIGAEAILECRPNTLILRMGTLHGMSERMRFDLVVNAMTRDAVEKGTITVFGGGQMRPLINVWDAADFICDQVYSDITGIHNLATENLSIDQVAHDIHLATDAFVDKRTSGYEDSRDYSMSCEFELDRPTYVGMSSAEIALVLREGRIKDPYDRRYINAK